MDKVQYYLTQLDKELAKCPSLAQLDKKLGHPQGKSFAVLAGTVLYLVLVVFNVAGSFLTNLLGFVYPAYASFKAIESKAFNVLESFSESLLGWVPFYFVIKCAVIVYLALPQTKGAVVVYRHLLRPYLIQHSSKVDATLNKVKKNVQEALGDKDAAKDD